MDIEKRQSSSAYRHGRKANLSTCLYVGLPLCAEPVSPCPSPISLITRPNAVVQLGTQDKPEDTPSVPLTFVAPFIVQSLSLYVVWDGVAALRAVIGECCNHGPNSYSACMQGQALLLVRLNCLSATPVSLVRFAPVASLDPLKSLAGVAGSSKVPMLRLQVCQRTATLT